jgi:6-phosphogluconate dehydrogenase
MDIGMIGLGRMGSGMAERLLRGDHRVVGYDPNPDAVRYIVSKAGEGANSPQELVSALTIPRHIWIMVPAGKPVDETLDALIPLLQPGDVVIDGGNSNYKDTLCRHARLEEQSLHFVDAGTSGGIWGLSEGYCLMVGGDREVVEALRPALETLAPAPDRGWGHVGPAGSGHFVKMIHNGIEYGMMQAYAEGFAILREKDEFGLDLHNVAEIWRDGSVIRSWLLDLTSTALEERPDMAGIAPQVADSGEGRWTVQEAIDLDVPAPVITLSLIQRLRSRDSESFADRLLAAMRAKFGGHDLPREQR